MVKLTLTPHRGNGARTFPSTGFLGMTPVTLAGVVRVKIEEDLKTVEASSLVVRVRCYESLGTGGAPSTSTTKERRSSASAAANGGSSSSYHSSSCLGGASSSSTSHSSSYSFSDLFKGGAPSSTSSSNANSGSTSNAKGRVLYEKSIQMWSPPISPTITTTSASGTSTPLSSRSSSQDTSPPHAYPPRSRDTSTSSSSDSSGSSEKYATLGDFTKAWRIVIPINAVEQGAKSTMIFKNWRIWWAVEAGKPFSRSPKLIYYCQVANICYRCLRNSYFTSSFRYSWR